MRPDSSVEENAKALNLLPRDVLTGIVCLCLMASPLLYIDRYYMPSEFPRHILIAIMAVSTGALFARRLISRQISLVWHPIQVAVLLLTVLALASGLWAMDPGGYELNIVTLCALIIVYLVATHLHQHSLPLLLASLVVASIAAMIGLIENFEWYDFGLRDASAMASTFVFKNHAALYFDLIVPIGFALILVTSGPLRWAITVMTALCTAFLLETHTRGSWLALGVGAIVMISILYANRTRLGISTAAVRSIWQPIAFIVLVCSAVMYSPTEIDQTWERKSYYGEEHLDTSSNRRLQIYRNSLSMLADKPFGVGLGSFWKGFRLYNNHPVVIPGTDASVIIYRAHSEPIQFFLELGIPGGTLVLLIFFYLFIQGTRTALNMEDRRRATLLLGICTAFLVSGIHAVVDFPLHKPSSALQFWLYAGLITGAIASRSDRSGSSSDHGRRLAIPLILIVTLLCLQSIRLYTEEHHAQIHHRLAADALEDDCATALEEIDIAMRFSERLFLRNNTRVDVYFKCIRDEIAALPLFEQALEVDNTNIKALIRRGYALIKLRRYEEAYRDFRLIAYILPHRPYGRYGIAQTIISSGEIERGIAELEKVIERFPDFKDAQQQLADLQRYLEGRTDGNSLE